LQTIWYQCFLNWIITGTKIKNGNVVVFVQFPLKVVHGHNKTVIVSIESQYKNEKHKGFSYLSTVTTRAYIHLQAQSSWDYVSSCTYNLKPAPNEAGNKQYL